MNQISGAETIDTTDPVAKMIDEGANYYFSKLPAPTMISKQQMQEWEFHVYVAFADNRGVPDSG